MNTNCVTSCLFILGHIQPIRPVIREIFNALHKYRSSNTTGYKDLRFVVNDEKSYIVIKPDDTKTIVKI